MIEKNQQLQEQEKKITTHKQRHTHTLRKKNDGLKPNFVFFK